MCLHPYCKQIPHREHVVAVMHYSNVIMGTMASQITSLTTVLIFYLTVYLGADQRTNQRSTSLAFVWWIHRWPVNSQHKRPVAWQMLPFDDVIVVYKTSVINNNVVFIPVQVIIRIVYRSNQQTNTLSGNQSTIWSQQALIFIHVFDHQHLYTTGNDNNHLYWMSIWIQSSHTTSITRWCIHPMRNHMGVPFFPMTIMSKAGWCVNLA